MYKAKVSRFQIDKWIIILSMMHLSIFVQQFIVHFDDHLRSKKMQRCSSIRIPNNRRFTNIFLNVLAESIWSVCITFTGCSNSKRLRRSLINGALSIPGSPKFNIMKVLDVMNFTSFCGRNIRERIRNCNDWTRSTLCQSEFGEELLTDADIRLRAPVAAINAWVDVLSVLNVEHPASSQT